MEQSLCEHVEEVCALTRAQFATKVCPATPDARWRVISLEQVAGLGQVRQSVGAQEPGGGRMIELVQCLLNGPAEEPNGTDIR